MSHIMHKLAAATVLCGLMGCADGESGDVIGPRGGMVVSDDGRLTLHVPAGALDESVAVEIITADSEQDEAVGPTYTLLPVGTAFRVPATVNYDLDALPMDDVNMDTLALVVERDDTWFYLADQIAEDGMISASAVYLSSFTVVADQAEDEDDNDQGHGNDKDKDPG